MHRHSNCLSGHVWYQRLKNKKQNSDIRMSTIDNPERQMMKLLTNIREKRTFYREKNKPNPKMGIPQDPRTPINQNPFPKTLQKSQKSHHYQKRASQSKQEQEKSSNI